VQVLTGTVTLNGPAPTGTARVNLTSDVPGVVFTPAIVRVQAGETQGTFTVTTPGVQATTIVTANANYTNDRIYRFTIEPPRLKSPLAISPRTFQGGSPTVVNLTLELESAAPAGGLTINLESTHPSIVSLPATVVIPQGTTTVVVPLTHFSVGSQTVVTIRALHDGVLRSRTVTVNP
jgi:trimeric autotransporter adhesin